MIVRVSALMPAAPLLSEPEELAAVELPATDGSVLTKSAMLFVGEVLRISSCVATVSGVGGTTGVGLVEVYEVP